MFSEQWDEVVRLGETALKLREDPLLKSNLDRARQKLDTIRQQELYDQGISTGQELHRRQGVEPSQ
ncbi:hypothetical protein PORUE0001_1426 [Porphyromonas uenonis 60-3]|uniref:Uncharacterized protein n=1 Tax=Porphyromonas uenonis 60-3 TaxID=596327 RepID=C2MDD1_9PORP|nr:hypothetical protein PORUE0001_1426 [Porphyromonas uenonis 60-3]